MKPARLKREPIRTIPSNPRMQYGISETGMLPADYEVVDVGRPDREPEAPCQPDTAPVKVQYRTGLL